VTKLADWINSIPDKALAALLRGLVFVDKGDLLTFIWHSQFHKETGAKREADIRQHLGGLRDKEIAHITLAEWGQQDPMIGEALKLGARVKAVE
jgi:hypothetical protein